MATQSRGQVVRAQPSTLIMTAPKRWFQVGDPVGDVDDLAAWTSQCGM
jgi:hypothetical protein